MTRKLLDKRYRKSIQHFNLFFPARVIQTQIRIELADSNSYQKKEKRMVELFKQMK